MKKIIKKHACAIFWIIILIHFILVLILGWETFKLILTASSGLFFGFAFNYAIDKEGGYPFL